MDYKQGSIFCYTSDDEVCTDQELESAIKGFDPSNGQWVVAEKMKRKRNKVKAPANNAIITSLGNEGSDVGSVSGFCQGGPAKTVCGKPVRKSDSGVSCDKCDSWFHARCQGIPIPAYEALSKYQVLTWLCTTCKESLKGHNLTQLASLESKVDQLAVVVKDHTERLEHPSLLSKVESLSKTVEKHMKLVGQSLKEQERAVDSQTKLIERSIRDNVSQKVSYAEMVKGSCSDVHSERGPC